MRPLSGEFPLPHAARTSPEDAPRDRPGQAVFLSEVPDALRDAQPVQSSRENAQNDAGKQRQQSRRERGVAHGAHARQPRQSHVTRQVHDLSLRLVLQAVHHRRVADHAQGCAQVEAVGLRRVRQGLHASQVLRGASAHPHRRETVPLCHVRQIVYAGINVNRTPPISHGRASLYLHALRKGFRHANDHA